MRTSKRARDLAQRAFDYIHEHPEKHVQNWFFKNKNSGAIISPEPDPEDCGTTMCVGGTVAWLHYGDNVHEEVNARGGIEVEAARLLGLNLRERDALFYDMNEERAVQKLKKIIVGEPFSEQDLYRD
jgi:hypothetical protein